jgi:hypothetical protein
MRVERKPSLSEKDGASALLRVNTKKGMGNNMSFSSEREREDRRRELERPIIRETTYKSLAEA